MHSCTLRTEVLLLEFSPTSIILCNAFNNPSVWDTLLTNVSVGCRFRSTHTYNEQRAHYGFIKLYYLHTKGRKQLFFLFLWFCSLESSLVLDCMYLSGGTPSLQLLSESIWQTGLSIASVL